MPSRRYCIIFISKKMCCFFTVKPEKTAITVLDTAVVGKTVTIMCQSDGLPEPSYTIIHNDTQVSTEKTYIISKVNWRDGGLYQCVAINKLGHDLKSYCLTVKGKILVR